jgi:pimeloyl-ACP methyl ester carboxylesterase
MRAGLPVYVCAVLLLAGGTDALAAPLDFDPCNGTPDYECASLDVPLDPVGDAPGTLRLHVRRLIETRDASEVLVALAGGPGQSSTRFIDDFADVLAEGLENRQLVVLDTRGTGDSAPLACDALDGVSSAATARKLAPRVSRCGRQLGESRRFYTTTEVVGDLEALRVGLEVERISLFGVSYGAYVAQRYARRFPAATDRLVLDSPVAQDQGGPFDASSYAAVSRMLRGLCAGGRCRAITRDPVADLRSLARRLRQSPLRARVFNFRGDDRTLRLAAQAELFDLFVSSDFSPALRGALPAAVRAATREDAAPLLRLLAIDNGSNDPREFDEQNEDPVEFSNALFFATTCQEKPVPWGSADAPLAGRRARRNTALAELPAGTFSPFGRSAADSTQLGTTLCERWPPTRVARVPDPGPIDAPALVLSGLTDLRTPTIEARRTAALISDASLVPVPGAGHSLVSSRLPCVQTALTRFFAEESVGNPCAGPPARALALDPAPLAPKRLRDVRTEGIRGRGARVVAAALATLRDSARVAATRGLLDAPFAFGGLRGGSTCARPGQAGLSGARSLVLVLRRSAYVPGLAVSGRAVVRGRRIVRAALSTVGRPDLTGRLRLRGRRVEGRLDRRRLQTRVSTTQLSVPRLLVASSLASGRGRACT